MFGWFVPPRRNPSEASAKIVTSSLGRKDSWNFLIRRSSLKCLMVRRRQPAEQRELEQVEAVVVLLGGELAQARHDLPGLEQLVGDLAEHRALLDVARVEARQRARLAALDAGARQGRESGRRAGDRERQSRCGINDRRHAAEVRLARRDRTRLPARTAGRRRSSSGAPLPCAARCPASGRSAPGTGPGARTAR